MSLAIDFLTAYFEQPGVTRADFAKAAGVDASLVTNIIQGDVLIGPKNLPKLLRGFRNDRERREFLAAHLRDQVPHDFADEVIVHLAHDTGADGKTDDDSAQWEHNLVHAFRALPSDSYRKRVVRFLRVLRKDDALRDLFTRTMRFIDDGESPEGDPIMIQVAAQQHKMELAATKAEQKAKGMAIRSPRK